MSGERKKVQRAIIVSGGSQDGLKDLIGEVSEADFLIGVDRGTLALLKEGFVPHVALGDFDSISAEELKEVQQAVRKVYVFPAEKDQTDTEAALDFVKREIEAQEIVLLGMFGGRVDHMISNLWLCYQPEYRSLLPALIMKNRNNTVRFFAPGHYTLIKQDKMKYISFIGMTALKGLTLEEVKYPLQEAGFPYPIALVSNELLREEMRFSFSEGLLVAIQSKDEGEASI